jgi:ribosomal protein L7Ae-like RNA K-turn-binding protein
LVRKSLRREVDATGLLDKVRAANDAAVIHALTLAARSGSLVAGGQRVRESITSGNALAAIFASNCSPRMKADIISRCKGLTCVEFPLTVDELGERIGKGQRAVLIVISSSTGRNLLRELDCMLALR